MTEANCCRFCDAACRACNCVVIGGMRCSRTAATSVGNGLRVTPPGPLKLARVFVMLTVVLLMMTVFVTVRLYTWTLVTLVTLLTERL